MGKPRFEFMRCTALAGALLVLAFVSCSKPHEPDATQNTEMIDFAKRSDQAHMIEGWKVLEWTGGKFVVWSDGPHSELAFSSLHPETKLVHIRCMPINYPATPPQIIRVLANNQQVAEIPLSREWNEYEFVLPGEALRQGENRLGFQYGYGQSVKTTISSGAHPPIAFDYLKIETLRETSIVDFGNPNSQSYLIDGWYEDEHKARLDYVWSKGDSSRLRFAVSELSDKQLQIRCMPLPDKEQPVQKIRISVNGNPVSEINASGDWKEYSFTIPASNLKLGNNILEFNYSHPRIADENDFRVLAVAVDYIRFKSLPSNAKTANASIETAPGSSPQSGSARGMNVMIFALDALRADHLGIYGYSRKTSPEIDRIAASGIVFERAFSQAPFTLASVCSYFTSAYPLFITGGQSLHKDSVTLAEVMRENGYQTAAISANLFVSKTYDILQGFDRIREFAINPRMNDSSAEITSALPAMLDELAAVQRPFFLYVHSFNPHSPYMVPQPFWSAFREPGINPVPSSNEFLIRLLYGQVKLSKPEEEDLIAQYDGGILFGDSEIAKTIRLLKERNLLNSTIFIILSDHGEEFLDHGGVLHGGQLFDEMIHVPLIVWNERLFGKGKRISAPVELVDVMPTILDLTGAQPSSSVRMQGKSLVPQLVGNSGALTQRVTYSYEPDLEALSIRDARWKFTYSPHGLGYGTARKVQSLWLFDLLQDPEELRNKADGEPVLTRDFHERALAWIALQKENLREFGPKSAKGPDLDLSEKERLRALGYVQ